MKELISKHLKNHTYPRWLRGLARLLWKLQGWKLLGKKPQIPKYLLVVAPHTTNQDFFYYLGVSMGYDIHPYFIAKKDIFNGLLGPFMRSIGGIPIDRSARADVVDLAAAEFRNHDEMVIAILPEGTRKKKPYWKSGFYYIALEGQVPIVMVSMNFKEKWIRLSEPYMLTGDQQRDLDVIRTFYSDARGIKPENFSDIVFQERQENP
ncbi:1-acyl-sn-glycerol-3-phosphate acyltransferase [Deinococcus roseus]|uniref:Acyltransferase n=1 Tax=Deinococcus roseus TaxID=392414 RepID=A0ABQ2D1Q5_9DEIO|nr:1-acyl-sn-glycerol-3-phosphate acyltransferase [Deinococcus roseus]GGJ42180.1 acyltransferase [Deinococcus roseus]